MRLRVAVGDSGLCCCVHVWHLLSAILVCWFYRPALEVLNCESELRSQVFSVIVGCVVNIWFAFWLLSKCVGGGMGVVLMLLTLLQIMLAPLHLCELFCLLSFVVALFQCWLSQLLTELIGPVLWHGTWSSWPAGICVCRINKTQCVVGWSLSHFLLKSCLNW